MTPTLHLYHHEPEMSTTTGRNHQQPPSRNATYKHINIKNRQEKNARTENKNASIIDYNSTSARTLTEA